MIKTITGGSFLSLQKRSAFAATSVDPPSPGGRNAIPNLFLPDLTAEDAACHSDAGGFSFDIAPRLLCVARLLSVCFFGLHLKHLVRKRNIDNAFLVGGWVGLLRSEIEVIGTKMYF